MMRLTAVAVTVAIAVPTLVAPSTVQAGDGGAVAAGVAGGLLGGLFLGSALAPRPYYAPAPAYVEPPPYNCYWTRGRAYWDDWRGVWVRPSVRVCE
jgi:hypothetical protein